MTTFKSVGEFLVETFTPNSAKKQLARSKALTGNQRWALAAAAQLTVQNKDSHNTLSPNPAQVSSDWQMALEHWWGVADHGAAVSMLQWLSDEGHRVKFRQSLGHDVLAWDLVRLINVARWGYAARYLQEEEAWTSILAAATRLHAHYGSWAELATDYGLGHDAWAEESSPQLIAATAGLLGARNTRGPWKSVAWEPFRNLQ